MSRPRRSLQSKNYADSSSEDGMDAQIEGSMFDSASETSQNDPGSNQKEFSDIDDPDSSEVETTNTSLFPQALSASQVQHTRNLVVEQAAELAEIQAKYEQHSALANQYQSRMKGIKKMLFENRAKVAPINRVPPEILGVIFSFHVGDNLESPWTLMKVCRAWRATSLLTRAMWRGIMLVPDEWRWTNPGRRAFKGMQVCMEEAHIQSALKRAGSISLDIRIAAVSPTSRSHRYSADLQRDKVQDLIQEFLNNLPHSRIRSLFVDISDHFELSDDTFDQFPIADLESLAIDFNCPRLLGRVKKESSHLTSLHIPSTSANRFANFGRWDQVVDLAITHVCGTQSNILPILAVATRLVSLQLDVDLLRSSDDDGTPLVMPFLSKLYIRSNEFWPLICLNLTHLTIGHAANVEVPSDQSISLPCLIQLTCISRRNSIAILRAFKVRLLYNLTLMHSPLKSDSARGMKKLWPLQSPLPKGDPSEIEPVVIQLLGFAINPKLLAQTLKERPSVEEFITENVVLDSGFFDALTPVRNSKAKARGGKGKGTVQAKKLPGSKPGWSIGCPDLKRISLDLSLSQLKEESIAALKRSAETFLSQRENVDAPIDSLSIRFSMNRDWEELA